MKSKRYLITGGAGFIGSHIADGLLSQGYEVVILDNESTGLKENVPNNAIYYIGDVTNSADVELAFSSRLDGVFHIAGQASNIRSFEKPESDLATNVLGTINILKACIKYKVPRLLYASSMTVYGHPDTIPVAESQLPKPISYYGITKYAAERYVLSTALRPDINFNFQVTAFRMFNVYGERQRLDNPYQGVLGFFIGNMLRGESINIHSDGEQTRDFIYIQDVVAAWLKALNNPSAIGQVFNLGYGKAVSVNQLVDAVLQAGGRSRKDYPIYYSPCRPGDQRDMTADISKACKILKWEPKVGLDEGLSKTLSWAKRSIQI